MTINVESKHSCNQHEGTIVAYDDEKCPLCEALRKPEPPKLPAKIYVNFYPAPSQAVHLTYAAAVNNRHGDFFGTGRYVLAEVIELKEGE